MRVTTGVRHEAGRANLFHEELWEPIDRVSEVRRVAVGFAVPFLVVGRVFQSVIRTEIDDADSQFEQRPHRFDARPVR